MQKLFFQFFESCLFLSTYRLWTQTQTKPQPNICNFINMACRKEVVVPNFSKPVLNKCVDTDCFDSDSDTSDWEMPIEIDLAAVSLDCIFICLFWMSLVWVWFYVDFLTWIHEINLDIFFNLRIYLNKLYKPRFSQKKKFICKSWKFQNLAIDFFARISNVFLHRKKDSK